MKKLNQLILSSIFSIFLVSCSATNYLTMGTTDPAVVVLSPEIKKIGIINRSIPSETNTAADQLDKILSAEGKQLDKDGSEAAIESLKSTILSSGMAEEVLLIDSDPLVDKGLGILPASLSWNDIEALCQKYQVDAIFSLAFYDTNTKIDYRATTMLLPNDLGIKVAVPAHELTLYTYIKNGWRVYDPYQQRIADEFLCNDQIVSVGKGLNPVKAYEAIAGRKEALMQYSMNMGRAYASRLQPSHRRISRDYFVRGSHNFVVAKRRAQTGDWNGAAELWERETANTNPKIAGRAFYNMAIINEINGDLETAMDWASKAYTDYNNRFALRYLDALKYRNALNEELARQQSR